MLLSYFRDSWCTEYLFNNGAIHTSKENYFDIISFYFCWLYGLHKRTHGKISAHLVNLIILSAPVQIFLNFSNSVKSETQLSNDWKLQCSYKSYKIESKNILSDIFLLACSVKVKLQWNKLVSGYSSFFKSLNIALCYRPTYT